MTNTQTRKKKVRTIQRPQNVFVGFGFSFTKQQKKQLSKCLCSQVREVHRGKDHFRLYCDAITFLRLYPLSMGDWFSHGLLSMLVSGNIPVKNSHLFIILNVIHRFPGPSPLYFDRYYSILAKQKHPLQLQDYLLKT